MTAHHALSDTIIALATAPGDGALAVIRLSGPSACRIEAQLRGMEEGGKVPSHRLRRVTLRNAAGEVLDEAMAVQMHGPRSFTGEDVLELHLHGSKPVVQAVLAAAVACGARLAGPGEFTQRAFLNGRLDLAQAEAVGQLIAARSEAERQAATAQLQGGLSGEVQGLLDALEHLLSRWQAVLDFPEYPTGDGLAPDHPDLLRDIQTRLGALRARTVQTQRRGGRVVLAGPPNAGKSTLLNALVGEERALVDAEAGTTRDPVEVVLDGTGGGSWSVVDTAGVRDTAASALEARGIGMSERWAQRADVLCWVMPVGSQRWPRGAVFEAAWIIGSKADLVAEGDRAVWEAAVRTRGLRLVGCVAAAQQRGLTKLRAWLDSELAAGIPAGTYAVRQRHADALAQAAAALDAALQALEGGITLDAVALDVRAAAQALGAILGRSVDAAVLDQIFAQFCIGK